MSTAFAEIPQTISTASTARGSDAQSEQELRVGDRTART